jgi:hypothetical protein
VNSAIRILLMPFFLGIDGGGTKTRCVVGDEKSVLGAGTSSSSKVQRVGGSSHESIQGIVETAKFFEAQDAEEAMQILHQHNVTWIVSYDAHRVAQNSAQILGNPVPKNAGCYLLDRRPSEVPTFLRLSAQTARFKLFRGEKS